MAFFMRVMMMMMMLTVMIIMIHSHKSMFHTPKDCNCTLKTTINALGHSIGVKTEVKAHCWSINQVERPIVDTKRINLPPNVHHLLVQSSISTPKGDTFTSQWQ